MESSVGQTERTNDDDVFMEMQMGSCLQRALLRGTEDVKDVGDAAWNVSHLGRTIWGLFCAVFRIFPSTYGISWMGTSRCRAATAIPQQLSSKSQWEKRNSPKCDGGHLKFASRINGQVPYRKQSGVSSLPVPNVWQERKASFVWISGGICQLLSNGWQGGTKKGKPACRLKLCTQWSTAMTENLSLLKAANICCIYC